MKLLRCFVDLLGLRPWIERTFFAFKRDRFASLSPQAFLLMTPDYGNLGDQAIAIATRRFIQKALPNYEIVELPLSQVYKGAKAVKRALKKGDYVFLQGGGNMGNLWMNIEKARWYVLRVFKQVPILSFPVTATFTDDSKGRACLRKARKIYDRHGVFSILAREQQTLSFLNRNFPKCKTSLVPDIVLSLDVRDYRVAAAVKASFQLLCLRGDKEKARNDSSIDFDALRQVLPNLILSDTIVARNVTEDTRDSEIRTLLSLISASDFVVTDRMHMMIFSYLVGVPCYVFPSLDAKIPGTYQWISSAGITCLNKGEDVLEAVAEARKHLKRLDSVPSVFDEKYQKMILSLFKPV